MYFPSNHKVMIPATVAIGFIVASCGETKITQCNKLNQVINQADVATKTAKTGKPAALKRSASELEKVVLQLKAVEVEDEKLQSLQASFVTLHTDISKSFRKMAVAIEKQNPDAIESSLKFLKQARKQDTALVKEINTYCASK